MFLNVQVLEEQTSDAILSRLPQGLKLLYDKTSYGMAEAVPLRTDEFSGSLKSSKKVPERKSDTSTLAKFRDCGLYR